MAVLELKNRGCILHAFFWEALSSPCLSEILDNNCNSTYLVSQSYLEKSKQLNI